MENIKISVILPIYNGEKFLKRCITSIISQEYKNLELILINDGSTDETRQICEEYKSIDSRIKLINKKNEGVSKARNSGLEIATGKYVAFIDSDDWLEKETYGNAIKKMEEKNIDILKFSYIKEYGKVRKSYNYTINTNVVIQKKDYDKKVYPYMFSTYDMSSVCMTIFKREILDNIKFDSNLKYGEDFLFTTQAIVKSESIYVDPNFYYHYFCNNESATNKRDKELHMVKIKDIILANNKLFDELENKKELLELKNQRLLKELDQIMKSMSLDYNYREYRTIIKNVLKEILIPLWPEVERYNILRKNNFLYFSRIKSLEKIKRILKNLK